jgi:hypothetical protein
VHLFAEVSRSPAVSKQRVNRSALLDGTANEQRRLAHVEADRGVRAMTDRGTAGSNPNPG